MLIVAGLSIKNLHPRVWDADSPYYLPDLHAVMVSYGEFHRMPQQRRLATEQGLRNYLGVPDGVLAYLDNGAFSFARSDDNSSLEEYETFVRESRPDWYPIPRDYIPLPSMSLSERQGAFRRTMRVNRQYQHDGYVPVIHVGDQLESYGAAIARNRRLAQKPAIALGGIVPNLLRTSKAIAYVDVLADLRLVRRIFTGKSLHVFGIGGTATLHVAALLGIDSVDSAGWRNRAARGLIQLPGTGDRNVVKMGAWRGRELGPEEAVRLAVCPCPGCTEQRPDGLHERGIVGFSRRATHNLWVLLKEAKLVEQRITDGSYTGWYTNHLDNTIYRPLIDRLVDDSTQSLLKHSL